MKQEYDFTDAEQGKFYREIEDLDIPISLDSLNKIINALIKQDIEISKKLAELKKT
jgi:hypothetical protein